jgi:adenosylmethionine-8-amino-7-oxononanoate aminotransferase
MKDYDDFPPVEIVAAKGPYLVTVDGREIIDAISSWWCKSLGHAHPRVRLAVERQLDKFEHVIMANACFDVLVELSERLAALAPPLNKVFYVDNGSTAVEVAMKMSLQFHLQTGHSRKRRFAALENGYHGETSLTLATGDCGLYGAPFAELAPVIPKIKGIPYVQSPDAPTWDAMPDGDWRSLEAQLDALGDELAAVVFEPILQGAGGMKVYSQDFLVKLREWADARGVHLIADEIMTGFGRTGKALACQHAGIVPDFACLSKGLTAGWGAMAAVLTSTPIYEAFHGDYFSGKAFMHSNTYCGNATMAAAALETLKIYDDERVFERVERDSLGLRTRLERIAENTGALRGIRGIGFAAAADIVDPDTGNPFPKERRTGFETYKRAIQLGAWLRPLGDTIYFLPPLNTTNKVLDDLARIAEQALTDAVTS